MPGAAVAVETPAAAAAAGKLAATTTDDAPFRVADLVDKFIGPYGTDAHVNGPLKVLDAGFNNYGGKTLFYGQVSTLKIPVIHNGSVREAVVEEGRGRILVIDGEASMKCACLGDTLTGRAAAHGWAGIVVNGCIRDAITIAEVPIGMKALGTHPQKPGKQFPGTRDVPVVVGGVTINAGDWLYCDEDGMLVSPHELDLAAAKK